MENELNQEIMDKLTKVCLCKGISRATMKEAIAGGADTVEKVRKVTGAGSGSCGGRRCTPKIEELLAAAANAE
ncbi:(2Fe-2S)-binding protein [Propionispora vibrioides]|uniref:BFD-like [2Fe-2S] binding domain-containing protein n=1 Tax=Propionispora vibrioides TaxID=112903 RepID=A0A1H8WQ77_9FIRM|nr:(2Fe-2S)-binding protein [Propionispora vibrioides]SEP29795.1 BFD-like [2Fe-2S] binding domain-containing protein [Propionispora vibrioides]